MLHVGGSRSFLCMQVADERRCEPNNRRGGGGVMVNHAKHGVLQEALGWLRITSLASGSILLNYTLYVIDLTGSNHILPTDCSRAPWKEEATTRLKTDCSPSLISIIICIVSSGALPCTTRQRNGATAEYSGRENSRARVG